MKVTMLCGGVGGSRLAVPLAAAVGPGALTCVVNTGDDHWRYGLRICPDLDTNMYALAGMADPARGWGLDGDTFSTMDQLRRLGGDPWFSLGNDDLATHLRRTELLASGQALCAVTAELANHLGVDTRLLPMTDTEVSTRMRTTAGDVAFEEWFVRDEARHDVLDVVYEGAAAARPAPGVVEAIGAADLVILGPSNPVSSIGPILAVPGLREAVAAADQVVAVTPIVRGVPLRSEGDERRARSRELQLAARGLTHRAAVLADLYGDLVNAVIIDEADKAERAAIEDSGIRAISAPTIVRDAPSGALLVEAVLAAAG